MSIKTRRLIRQATEQLEEARKEPGRSPTEDKLLDVIETLVQVVGLLVREWPAPVTTDAISRR